MRDTARMLKKHFQTNSDRKLEKRILQLFKKHSDPMEIFEKIKNHPNVHQVSCFLYNSGLDKTLLNFSVRQLEKKKPVPWAYVLRLLIKYKITPKESLVKLLFHYWLKNEKNQSSALFSCEEWGDISPEFQQLRFVYIQDLEEKNLSEENDLLEQLEFVQAQELIKEEEEIIEKLLIIHPENKKYQKLQKDLEEKKAIFTIQDQKRSVDRVDRLEDYADHFSAKKVALREDWFKEIAKKAGQNPKLTKNLSLFLCFCERPDKSMDILSEHIGDRSDYWYYLDWALETRQYMKGLDLINHLLSEVKDSAVSFLPLIYIKSQILYALGKKSSAIEYLTAISQVQPDYKSVQYLLDKWLENT